MSKDRFIERTISVVEPAIVVATPAPQPFNFFFVGPEMISCSSPRRDAKHRNTSTVPDPKYRPWHRKYR